MRSGLIVREVRESIIGSRLGPALTVRFVRVHEGSLEARTPPHPPHPPAPPAPLLHPLHTPHAPHAHPMHTPCTPWCGAGRRRSSRRGCTQSAAQPDLGHRDRCAAGRPPATEPRSVTDPTPTPRPRRTDPDTPSATHRARACPPTVYSLRLPCYARRSCMSSRPPRGAGMSCGCASRTARPPNPNPNPNPHPNSSP